MTMSPIVRTQRLLPFLIVSSLASVLILSFLAILLSGGAVRAAGECSVSADDQAIDAEEQKMLTLINDYRRQNGSGPLTASVGLTRAAAWMSRDMATKGYFDHTDSFGRSPFDRMENCGYSSTAMGENIGRAYGYGSTTVDIIFNGWRNSPSHDAAMRNPIYRAAGIARSCSNSGCYWTLDLGAHIDAAVNNAPAASATPSPTTASLGQQATVTLGQPPANTATVNIGVIPRAGTAQQGPPQPAPVVADTTQTSGPARSATSPTTSSGVVTHRWLDRPATSQEARPACPAAGLWMVLYWDGEALDIAAAAALCPKADRFWVFHGGRWLGFQPGDSRASDSWTVQPGEAVFARAP